MATFNKFQPFVEAVAEGKHNFASNQLKIALCAAASAPVNTNSILANLTQATYTNLSSRDVTTSSSSQTSGTYSLVCADLTLTSTGGTTGPFRYVVLYNESAANDELIGWWDYGSDLTLADGESLTVDFGSSVLTIA